MDLVFSTLPPLCLADAARLDAVALHPCLESAAAAANTHLPALLASSRYPHVAPWIAFLDAERRHVPRASGGVEGDA